MKFNVDHPIQFYAATKDLLVNCAFSMLSLDTTHPTLEGFLHIIDPSIIERPDMALFLFTSLF